MKNIGPEKVASQTDCTLVLQRDITERTGDASKANTMIPQTKNINHEPLNGRREERTWNLST